MAMRIFLGTSGDATLFDGREPDASVDPLLSEVGVMLAAELQPLAETHWPELRDVFANCGLFDKDFFPPQVRFSKARGELEVTFAVDLAPLFPLAPQQQAAHLADVSCRAIAHAFAKQKQDALAQQTEAFRKRLDIATVVPPPMEEFEDEPVDLSAAFPRDASGRLRHVQALSQRRGTLWIMFEASGKSAQSVLKALESHVAKHKLGKPDGSSFGDTCADASFRVTRLADAATSIDRHLRDAFPALDYVISDDYEVVFDFPSA